MEISNTLQTTDQPERQHSIRGVFMRLAKMLHPDKISNKQEQAEKD